MLNATPGVCVGVFLLLTVSLGSAVNVVGKFVDSLNEENIGEAKVTLPTQMRSGETVRVSWEGVKAVTGLTSRDTVKKEPVLESGGDSVRLFLMAPDSSPTGYGVATLASTPENDTLLSIQLPNTPGGNNFYDWTVPELGAGTFAGLVIGMESSPYELDLRGDDFYQIVFAAKYIVFSNEFYIISDGGELGGGVSEWGRVCAGLALPHRGHEYMCYIASLIFPLPTSPRTEPLCTWSRRTGFRG
jgi:hypothetical protein